MVNHRFHFTFTHWVKTQFSGWNQTSFQKNTHHFGKSFSKNMNANYNRQSLHWTLLTKSSIAPGCMRQNALWHNSIILKGHEQELRQARLTLHIANKIFRCPRLHAPQHFVAPCRHGRSNQTSCRKSTETHLQWTELLLSQKINMVQRDITLLKEAAVTGNEFPEMHAHRHGTKCSHCEREGNVTFSCMMPTEILE